jgi:hypothetical protein
MNTIKFKDWELIVDRNLTEQTYKNASGGSAEGCVCNYCKNYLENREKAFPELIKNLFSELGIDYTKDSEVCHYQKHEDGLHHYSGWFHFKGSFVGKNCYIPLPNGGFTIDLTTVNETFSIGFSKNSGLAFFEKKENLVQVEFEAKIPWTIDKSFEG